MIIATILEAIFLFPTDVPRDNGSPVGCHFPRQITVFEPHIMATTPEWVPLAVEVEVEGPYSNVTRALGDSPLVARVNSPPVRGCVGSCVAG